MAVLLGVVQGDFAVTPLLCLNCRGSISEAHCALRLLIANSHQNLQNALAKWEGAIIMGQRGKPSIFHMAAYLAALTVGGKYGWLYGHDIGGIIVGAVFAIGGALIASTIVGGIAILLGHRP